MLTQLSTQASEARGVQEPLDPALDDERTVELIAILNPLVQTCRASARVLDNGSRCVESRIDASEIAEFAEQRLEFAYLIARQVEALGGEVPLTNGWRRTVRTSWLRLRNLLQSTGPAPTDHELLAALHEQDRRTIEDFDRALQSDLLPPELRLVIERLYGALIVQRFRLGEMMRTHAPPD